MAKVIDETYMKGVNKRELVPIFESYEMQIYRKLEEVDRLLALVSSEAATCGVKAEHCREFIQVNVTDMIDQIAEKREKEWRKRPRKRY